MLKQLLTHAIFTLMPEYTLLTTTDLKRNVKFLIGITNFFLESLYQFTSLRAILETISF